MPSDRPTGSATTHPRSIPARSQLQSTPRARGEPQAPPADIVDQLFCASVRVHAPDPRQLRRTHGHLTALQLRQGLMVTSPPCNCGKDYDQDLDLDEFMAMLELLITETFRVLEPGGRVAINVANLGRKLYIPLTTTSPRSLSTSASSCEARSSGRRQGVRPA